LTKNFILPSFYSKDVEFLTQIDVFKSHVSQNLPSPFPQKSKIFLPAIPQNSTRIIDTFYPKKLLRVKQNQSIVDVPSKEITLFVFDQRKIIGFAIFFLLSFSIYNFFKKKNVLKQKLYKNFFRKIYVFSKKHFILKLKERFFSKLMDYLKDLSQAQVREKLKRLEKRSTTVLSSSAYSLSLFFINEFIYMEKVQENREENTLTLSCKHYFLTIKKNDIVVLTRNFPTLSLSAGTQGIVDGVLLHQKLEVTFFTTTNLSEIVPKFSLEKYQTSLVRKEDISF